MIEDLRGKSYEEIADRLIGVKRERLVRLLQLALTLEPHFSLDEVSALRGIPKPALLERIQDGRLRAHLPASNRYRIPKSAVDELDAATRHKPSRSNGSSPDA